MQKKLEDSGVLVVDDIAENRDLLIRRLKRLGLRDVEEATNGREALAAIDRRAFDLVLLDIMMPEMNGFQVLEKLREDGRIQDLPVVVISALNEIEPVVKCIELGAEDFIFKPFNPTLLRARVLSILEKKALRDATREELRRKRAELNEARVLQLALQPAPHGGSFGSTYLTIDTILEPAKEVGGDLVDHFPLGDQRWAFISGDVSDKGAGAALMMARTHAMFRGLATRSDAASLFEQPEVAVGLVNAALATGNDSCMFVTLLVGVFDPLSMAFRYVRAGHVEPCLLHADCSFERLSAKGGLPLGIRESATYESASVTLRPGDAILAVTDGITEAFDPEDEAYGEDRVINFIRDYAGPANDFLKSLLASVREFAGAAPQSDDIAAIYIGIGVT